MIKWLFGVAPKVGSKWAYSWEIGNPFHEYPSTVTICAIRGKWVQYTPTRYFSTREDTIRSFREVYRRVE